VLVGTLTLLRQLALAFFGAPAHYVLDVLLDSWARIESHIHYIKGRLTRAAYLLLETLVATLMRPDHIRSSLFSCAHRNRWQVHLLVGHTLSLELLDKVLGKIESVAQV